VLCERVGDSRHPEARPRVQAVAAGAGAAAAFAQGCLRMADRRFDEAADAFERAAKQQQGSAVYHFWLGQAYGAQAQQANVSANRHWRAARSRSSSAPCSSTPTTSTPARG
jgi:uncharacterized protein HemY